MINSAIRVLLLLLSVAATATGNVAQFSGSSHVLTLDVVIRDWGDGLTRQFFLTTYDGNTDARPLHIRNGNLITVSGEMKEVGGRYKTDYLLWVPEISTVDFVDWGVLDLAFASADANSNNIIDLAEKSESANVSATGSWTSMLGDHGGATGTFEKNAGANEGSYTLTLTNTAVGAIDLTAPFYAMSLAGTLTYDVSTKNATLNFVSTVKENTNFAGETSYAVINDGEFELAAMTIVREDGPIDLPKMRFTRNAGITYTATVILPDGEPLTPWVDYQNFTLKILDSNDSDNDGIPDISDDHDDLPPTISINRTVRTYTTATTQVNLLSGVTATDNLDGTITDRITTNGAIDLSQVGEYIITYSVSDNAGNLAQAHRTYRIILADIDVDGLDDGWETDNLGSLAFAANDNPDNDDLTNLEEYLHSSDPLVANIVIQVHQGWNLIGVGENATITNLDDISGEIWAYQDGNFVPVTVLAADGGYWIYSLADGLIVLKN
jgi:hypothetical protein